MATDTGNNIDKLLDQMEVGEPHIDWRDILIPLLNGFDVNTIELQKDADADVDIDIEIQGEL